jgi:SAM-dependent methyltransferase
MVSFDKHVDSYGDEVARAIGFANVDHAHVTTRKVEHLLALCTDLLGSPSEQRVLDVGCGVGLTDRLLVDRVASLHGIDISVESVAEAAKTNPSARYTPFDGTTFPLDDQSVDLAFAICVLHHVPPDERVGFTAELRRVVRPGGIVVIFEHNPLNPLTRVAVSRCDLDEGVLLARRRTTARLLEGSGLRVERSAYVIFTPTARWAAGVDRALRWCPAGAQYYVAARRGDTSG